MNKMKKALLSDKDENSRIMTQVQRELGQESFKGNPNYFNDDWRYMTREDKLRSNFQSSFISNN